MAQLLDVFGFLSVLLRGLTLLFQSLVIGGLVFNLFVLGPVFRSHPSPFRVRPKILPMAYGELCFGTGSDSIDLRPD